MRAFVTGATGFVGSHLVECLRARGDQVRALARRPESHAALAAFGAEPVAGSLDDPAGLAAAIDGCDVVYHVAGLTSGTEAELLAVNEAGTRTVLHASTPARPRFVLISSQAALGPSRPGERLAEDAPCHPVTAYGRSKLAGERVVRDDATIPWTIVRPSPVYGPRDREFLRLFRIVRSGFAPVFGLGRQELSMVHARDLAELIARAGRQARAEGLTYHAAHSEVVTAAEVARAAGAAIGRRPLTVPVPPLLAAPIVRAIGRAAAAAGRRTVVTADKLGEFLASGWVMDVTRAERDLGWRAVLDLATGFADTAAWYQAEGWL